MNNKSIMLCLEKLGIGRVESAVINLSKVLIEKGYNVIVLVQKGIYTNNIKSIGIKFIEYNISIDNFYSKEN